MKKCENCSCEHDGSYGSGRFCSVKCARGFSTKAKRKEINKKISKSIQIIANEKKKINKHYDTIKKCKRCNTEFIVVWKYRNQIYCSRKCARIENGTSEIAREKISKAQLKLVKEGKHVGWKSRTKAPSYPEKYFIDLFNKENINEWTREYKVGKYFIDFAFINSKIALEIDGKQHWLDKDRIKSDRLKDNFLKEKGWEIIRIKWFNPINETNKKKLYEQINIFKNKIKER